MPPERGRGLGTSPIPLVDGYDAALLDLDGVLYLGDESVAHAPEAVAAARAAGMRLAYVTNNASRAPAAVAQRLTALGMPARAEEVVTSSQAAARALAAQLPPGAAVLVVGSDALADEVAAVGLRPVRTVAAAGDGGPAAVVQGLSTTTSWADLAEAAVALHGGALWVAGNADATLPTTRGQLPGNGAFVAALQLVTGREPVVVGKPHPQLHQESVTRVSAQRPLVVGDRLDTDVLGAVRGGSDSLLVLTGVTGLRELVAARPGERPTYVAPDLRGLLEPQPPVQVEGEIARCGEQEAAWHDTVLVGAPADVAGLRAMTALAWALNDRGLPVQVP